VCLYKLVFYTETVEQIEPVISREAILGILHCILKEFGYLQK